MVTYRAATTFPRRLWTVVALRSIMATGCSTCDVGCPAPNVGAQAGATFQSDVPPTVDFEACAGSECWTARLTGKCPAAGCASDQTSNFDGVRCEGPLDSRIGCDVIWLGSRQWTVNVIVTARRIKRTWGSEVLVLPPGTEMRVTARDATTGTVLAEATKVMPPRSSTPDDCCDIDG